MVVWWRKCCFVLGVVGMFSAVKEVKAFRGLNWQPFQTVSRSLSSWWREPPYEKAKPSSPEMVDVLDSDGKLTGESVSRKEADSMGIFHGVVRACILNEGRNDLLLQQRSLTTEDYAGKWSLTAGHIKAAETPTQALSRELKEELCLDLSDINFVYQGQRTEEGDGTPPIRHFVHHYIVVLPKGVTPAVGEDVAAINFVPVHKVLQQPESYFGDLTKFYEADLTLLQGFLER